MDYSTLSKEDFDAIVTGELTHYSLWLEHEAMNIIAAYFAWPAKADDFERIILRRDGLTFANKLDILRAMLPLFKNQDVVKEIKELLVPIEEFNALRNALAHGRDITPKDVEGKTLEIHVEIVSRSGKERTVVITPNSHAEALQNASALLKRLETVNKILTKESFDFLIAEIESLTGLKRDK